MGRPRPVPRRAAIRHALTCPHPEERACSNSSAKPNGPARVSKDEDEHGTALNASRRIAALRGGGSVCAPVCAAMLLSMRAGAHGAFRKPSDSAGAKNQPAAVGNDRWSALPVSGLLFTGNGATPTCRAVSARGDSDRALGGIGPRGAGSPTYDHQRRGASANETRRQDGGCNSPRRPPPQIPMRFGGPACVMLEAQKKPPAGCPAGGRQLKSSREHQGTMSRWTRTRSP
jgi:hypothetical protein